MTDRTEPHTTDDDAHAAFLALGAASDGESSRCPSAEELAAFVENPSGCKERRRMLDHLGECHSCYEQWLALHQHIPRRSRRRWAGTIAGFLGSRRALAWAGSAMGIAAAVVVFLQLGPDSMDIKQVETSISGAVDEQVMNSLPAPMEDAESADSSVTAPPERAVPDHSEESAGRHAAGQQQFSLGQEPDAPAVGKRKAEELAAPEPGTPAPAEKRTPDAADRVDKGLQSAAGGGEMDAVLELLGNGCGGEKWQKSFWREMEEKLVQAGSRDTAVAGSRSFRQLSQLVSLAAENGGDEKICAEIMAISEGIRY